MRPTGISDENIAWPVVREMVRCGLEAITPLPPLEFESQTVTEHRAQLKKTDWRADILAALKESVEPAAADAARINTLMTRFHSPFKAEFESSRMDGWMLKSYSSIQNCPSNFFCEGCWPKRKNRACKRHGFTMFHP